MVFLLLLGVALAAVGLVGWQAYDDAQKEFKAFSNAKVWRSGWVRRDHSAVKPTFTRKHAPWLPPKANGLRWPSCWRAAGASYCSIPSLVKAAMR